MTGRPFLDSNVVLYSVVQGDPRSETAASILAAGAWISMQVLAEVIALARRKLAMPWPDIDRLITHLHTVCPDPVQVGPAIFRDARRIAERYGYRIFDAQVLAAAISINATLLFSEHMQHGQVIDGRLTIRSPFLPA
jgi:predicted nucleic acid-binding protein